MANIIRTNNKKVYSLGSIPAGEIIYFSHKNTPYMVVDKRCELLKNSTNVLITYIINLETGMLIAHLSDTEVYWYDGDVILQD